MPHCWKSGIGVAASWHMAVTTPVCPFIEFLPPELCDSPLRKELLLEEFRLKDGVLALPERPGLGVTLSREALARFRADEQVVETAAAVSGCVRRSGSPAAGVV